MSSSRSNSLSHLRSNAGRPPATMAARRALVDQLSGGRWNVSVCSEKQRRSMYGISNTDEVALLDIVSAFHATGVKMDKRHSLTTDRAGDVVELDLYLNDRMSSLPAEVAQLSKLRKLTIQHFSFGTSSTYYKSKSSRYYSSSTTKSLSSSSTTTSSSLSSSSSNNTFHYHERLCLPPEIGKLQNLQELHISTLHDFEFPPQIGNIKQLKILSLSHCRITRRLPKEIEQLINLQEIRFYNVHFKRLPLEIRSIAASSTFKKLVLQSLEFPILLAILEGMKPSKSLSCLILQHNKLTTNDMPRICRIISKFPNLKELDLSYNDIDSMDGFSSIPKIPCQLQKLYLRKLELSDSSCSRLLVDWCSDEYRSQQPRGSSGGRGGSISSSSSSSSSSSGGGGHHHRRHHHHQRHSHHHQRQQQQQQQQQQQRGGHRGGGGGGGGRISNGYGSHHHHHYGRHDACSSIIKLLTRNARLYTIGGIEFEQNGRYCFRNNEKSNCTLYPYVQHLLDINLSGRILFQRDHNKNQQQSLSPIPLSVWPVVFERINTKFNITSSSSPGTSTPTATTTTTSSSSSSLLKKTKKTTTTTTTNIAATTTAKKIKTKKNNNEDDESKRRAANAMYYMLRNSQEMWRYLYYQNQK